MNREVPLSPLLNRFDPLAPLRPRPLSIVALSNLCDGYKCFAIPEINKFLEILPI